MPKRFEDLTPAQQAQVKLMYQNNLLTITDYLYNFDAQGKYTGRQIAPIKLVQSSSEFYNAEEIAPEKPIKKARKK